ncbi:MAG: NADP-dependent oxidoreductase [Flavisolibacter sp.]
MKAIQIHQYGGPDQLKLEEVPVPEIQEDEVLVKVFASGVNPIDWKVRKGLMKQMISYHFPLILGWDFSGVVEKLGAGVTQFKKGDAVYGRPDTTRNGSYAEYLAVKADQIAPKPGKLSHTEAAGVPLAGLTAWQGLMVHGGLRPGQRLLINGAAGGVGSFAVQFARAAGAYVIGTASAANKDFLLQLGVDEAIDYKKPGFEKDLKGLDVVLDTVGGEEQAKLFPALKKGGILVSTVGIREPHQLEQAGVRGKSFMAQSVPEDLKQIADLIDKGKVRPQLARVFPLASAAAAQELSEKGHVKGKLVLEILAGT